MQEQDRELMDILVPLDCPTEGRFAVQVLFLLSETRISQDRACRLLGLTQSELLRVYEPFLGGLLAGVHAGFDRTTAAASMGRVVAAAFRAGP